jgi:hypothetical protein
VVEFGNTFLSSSGVNVNIEPGLILLDPKTPPPSFPYSGFLVSSILDTQWSDPPWQFLMLDVIKPHGTSIGIQIRASDNYKDMGPWSEVFTETFVYLYGILDESASYVQYRVILSTSDPDTTPAIKSFNISWHDEGTGESNSPVSYGFLQITPNPAVGPVEALVNLSSPAPVEILVFDLSGRLVKESGITEYEPGSHTVMLGEFAPGVYNVLMHSPELAVFSRFAVVE